MHEASEHPQNCWITLTYNDEHLPEDKSLDKTHFQKFLKRWRRKLDQDGHKKDILRYYMCGEYGDPANGDRPHYHACIFGTNFPDQYHWRTNNGNKLYRSPTLEKLWTFGHSEIGDLTVQSAGYTARYIMKKQTGTKGQLEYGIKFDHDTGEVFREARLPPYTTMSLKPGIGRSWIEKYHSEVYPRDEVITNGKQARPPRYYDTFLETINPLAHGALKRKRIAKADEHYLDNTPERLKVKEEVLKAKTSTLSRSI